MTARLNQVLATNPAFSKALAAGEEWAVQHAECIRGIDRQASRRFPERAAREDGKPHNWCGSCIHPEGCVSCDLPEATGETHEALERYRSAE